NSALNFAVLSPQYVQVIDSIIFHTPPAAKEILHVSNAYNQVLEQHDMDRSEDVVSYRYLLKLGVVRGTWKERWESVKSSGGPTLTLKKSESTPRTKPLQLETPPPPTSGPPSLARFAKAAARAGKLKLASAGKKPPPTVTTPGGSVINDEQTWKLLEMQADANNWRRSRALKMCFYVWLENLRWFQRRSEQVELARSHVTLRHAMRIWHSRPSYYTDLNNRAVKVSNGLVKRSAWKMWKAAYIESRRKKWQEDMKRRMALIRQKSESRPLSKSFSIWIRRYRARQSTRIASEFDKRITFRHFVNQLRQRLGQIDEIEDIADRVSDTRDRMAVENAIAVWKRRVRLNRTERIVVGMQDARLIERLFAFWRNAVAYTQIAEEQRSRWILKKAIAKWQNRSTRLRIMERRAEDFMFNQETVLLRNFIRAWVAQERGLLLDASIALMKMTGIHDLELRSNTFTEKTRLALLRHAFAVWHQDFNCLQTYNVVAEQQYAISSNARTLVAWKSALADHVRKMKSAKIARRWFLLRREWRVWKKKLEERWLAKKIEEDERTLEIYEKEWLRKRFLTWHALAQKERQNRFLVMAFNEKIEQRVMSNSLNFWISRVVENKSRELQISDERDAILQRSAFERWRDVFRRHGEALHLMQSFHEVKQEYLLRRIFQRWLNLTRKSIQRQRRLEEVKEERRQAIVQRAWETWRGRFKEKELAPLERQFRAQMDIHILFRAYRIWESKTVYVPAMRYFSIKFKVAVLARWKEAAGPPLLARQAREWNRNTLLSKMFAKWKDAYREKSQLKAIARARHHRLPGAPISRPASAIARATARATSPERTPSLYTQVRNQRELEDEDDEAEVEQDKASEASRSPPRSGRPSRLAMVNRKRSPSIGERVKARSAIAIVRSERSVRTAPSESGRRPRSVHAVGDDRLDEDTGSIASTPRTAPFTRPRAGTNTSAVNALQERAATLAFGGVSKPTPSKGAEPESSPATRRERLRMELRNVPPRRTPFLAATTFQKYSSLEKQDQIDTVLGWAIGTFALLTSLTFFAVLLDAEVRFDSPVRKYLHDPEHEDVYEAALDGRWKQGFTTRTFNEFFESRMEGCLSGRVRFRKNWDKL
ncbi:hypothetical protein FRB90_002034, partial [Tulasnella sp. 427]